MFKPHPKPGKKKKKKRGIGYKALADLGYSVIERDNWLCLNPYCKDGHPLDFPHHVLKKSQGGKDVSDNLATICVYCHRKIHHTATLRVSGVYPDFIWDIKK